MKNKIQNTLFSIKHYTRFIAYSSKNEMKIYREAKKQNKKKKKKKKTWPIRYS